MSAEVQEAPRDRILRSAARLLAEGGRDAVSTRSVSAAANVQPQTIYRQFGDMRGLLVAVARHGFAVYLGVKKASESSSDPVEDLRRGWDLHVEFGLRNPALYTLMYGDPQPGIDSATVEIERVLHDLLDRVAVAGRLNATVDTAKRLILSASTGVVLSLIAAQQRGDRVSHDDGLATEMRDVVLSYLVSDEPASDSRTETQSARQNVSQRAIALTAVLPSTRHEFTSGEFALLAELLDRLGDRPTSPTG
jgi:AcrR family transcriptional regulator